VTLDNIVMIITVAISGVALFYSLKKQKHDEANVDADTISSLYDSLNKQEKRHKELKCEFEQYMRTTSAQISELASENFKLRAWARKLCRQLENAGITPTRFEDL